MRRALVLGIVLVALAAAACGASAAGNAPPIAFGIRGGNIPPYGVTIQPNGSVRIRGTLQRIRRQITLARVHRLRTEIQRAHLVSRRCPGVLPDFATNYIRLGTRTIAVHGTCEPRFQRVWNDLWRAVTRPSR